MWMRIERSDQRCERRRRMADRKKLRTRARKIFYRENSLVEIIKWLLYLPGLDEPQYDASLTAPIASLKSQL